MLPSISVPPELLALWGNDNGRAGILVLGGTAVVGSLLGRAGSKAQGKPEKLLPPTGGAGLIERRFRYQQPVHIGGMAIGPARLGGAHIDVAWRHIGILGTSGARKSTLMAMLIEQIGKRAVVLTADESPPLSNYVRSTDGLLWQPRGMLAWYPWGGPLEQAVQRCEFVFPATDSDKGVHRSMFKAAIRRAWSKVPEGGRKVEQVLVELAKVAASGGASARMMVENWSARLQEMIDSLGDSWKTADEGGFDVVNYLKQEAVGTARDAMFWLNSYVDVSNRTMFARVVVLEVLRAADAVGGITLAFDEIGLMGATLFAEAVRTLRVRLCTGIFASHIAKDYPEILRGLINIWFLGTCGAGDKPTREWASDTTFGRVPAENFGEHALPLGRFYLAANGRVQKLTVPTWKTRPVPEKAAETQPDAPVAETYRESTGESIQDAEVDRGASEEEFKAMVYERIKAVDGFRVWTGSKDNDGYPRHWWPKGEGEKSRYESVHRWVYLWETGDSELKGWTIDHVCGLKNCLDHLEKVTVAENTRRRHERERGERPSGHEGMAPPVREALHAVLTGRAKA